jgi:hypothetical protein
MTRSMLRASLAGPWLAAATLLASPASWGAAGQTVFVSGSVTAEPAAAPSRALTAGSEVETGETIATAERSRGQRYALRAGTRFRVDAFSLPPAASGAARALAQSSDGQSFFTLQKGGFRATSGAIGKGSPAAYEVRTPVGTLGIRGTVWAAVFCVDDCDDAPGVAGGQPIRNGLYLGVYEGRITFSGRGLNFELGAGEFAYVPLLDLPIERLQQPPAVLEGDDAGPLADSRTAGSNAPAQAITEPRDFGERRGPAPELSPSNTATAGEPATLRERAIAGKSSAGDAVDFTDGAAPARRFVAYGYAGSAPRTVSNGQVLDESLTVDATGSPTSFAGPFGGTSAFEGSAAFGRWALGSASVVGAGANATTGIRGGRWSGGAAQYTPLGGAPQAVNLAQTSLHWLLGPVTSAATVLPVSGTQTYRLIGATSPTDTGGAVGTLGGAFLSADFTNRTVTSTISLDLPNRNYWATGTVPLIAGSASFAGPFADVRVEAVTGSTGAVSGFLSRTDGGTLGAGLTYTLLDTRTAGVAPVSGAVALAAGAGVAPPPPSQRNLAFSAAAVGAQVRIDAAARVHSPRLVFDAAGNLVRFTAPAARGVSTPGDIYDTQTTGNTTTFQSGVDAASQIRWGRWIGGAYSIALAAGGSGSQSLSAAPLHWIAGSDLAQVVLPVTGTRSYVLVGASAPTDSLAQGNVGTFGGAFIAADFTQRTLSATVTLDIAGANWWATGVGALATGSNQFAGTFNDVRIDGVTGNGGTWSGFLTETQSGGPTSAGAGLAYTLIDTVGVRGSVQGVVALREGAGAPPPAPPPPGDRAVAIAIGAFATGTGPVAFVTSATNPSAQYGVGTGGVLTQFPALTPVSQLDLYGLGTSSNVNSGFDAGTGLRWGRWSGGVPTLPASPAQSLAAQSLHWVLGSSYAGAPVLPVTGSGFLTLVGNTSPTDTRGNVGTFGAASFSADFTTGGFTYAVLIDIDGRR